MRMQQAMTTLPARQWANGHGLRSIMAAALWRHRHIHALALAIFILALAVGARTGNMPDTGVLADYSFYLVVTLWTGCCCFALARLVWLAAVVRERRPLRALALSFRDFFGNGERLANAFNGILALTLFSTGFSVLKGAIAILSPFTWDMDLAALDRALHFGRMPHEWLWWIVESPIALRILNIAYNVWFVALIASMLFVAIARRDTRLRHQFMLSLMLVWVVGGFFIAMGLSSAGPCYFARLGLGGDYQALMDALGAANEIYPIWAVSTQDMLWNGYTGATQGSIGISAFPSLHVATATLFALYAWRRSRLAGIVMSGYAGVIMVGSVALAWHYAVDGYAGAAITLTIWKLTGWWLARYPQQGVEPA